MDPFGMMFLVAQRLLGVGRNWYTYTFGSLRFKINIMFSPNQRSEFRQITMKGTMPCVFAPEASLTVVATWELGPGENSGGQHLRTVATKIWNGRPQNHPKIENLVTVCLLRKQHVWGSLILGFSCRKRPWKSLDLNCAVAIPPIDQVCLGVYPSWKMVSNLVPGYSRKAVCTFVTLVWFISKTGPVTTENKGSSWSARFISRWYMKQIHWKGLPHQTRAMN